MSVDKEEYYFEKQRPLLDFMLYKALYIVRLSFGMVRTILQLKCI